MTAVVWQRTVGAARLFTLDFVVDADVTHNASNYQTVTAYHRRGARGPFAADAVGTPLGSLTTHDVDLVARSPVRLYHHNAGLAMTDGDTLVLEIAPTGSPAALVNPSVLPDIRRVVR